MEIVPGALRGVLNLVFYVVYAGITIFASGFIFPLFGIFFTAGDSAATKVTIVIAVLVLLITFIFRDFFYISLKKER